MCEPAGVAGVDGAPRPTVADDKSGATESAPGVALHAAPKSRGGILAIGDTEPDRIGEHSAVIGVRKYDASSDRHAMAAGAR